MKTICSPDNIACLFDQLVNNPMAFISDLGFLTVLVIFAATSILGGFALTRKG